MVNLSVATADKLALDAQARRQIELAALLHDVGEVAIPKEIINKPGPLTDEEWGLVRTHTIRGHELLARAGGVLAEVGKIVRASHERWDGLGYPDGLSGPSIPLPRPDHRLLQRVQRHDEGAAAPGPHVAGSGTARAG